MVSGGGFFRLPNMKGLRRRKENDPVGVEPAVQVNLPQEILQEIISEYRTSFPEQPLYPLLASRSLYEATIPCLYRSIVFTIKQSRRDRWFSLLTSLRQHGGLVQSLELTETAGPDDQTQLGRGESVHTFLDRLAELSQLRELSIKCLGAKLPVEILVTASRLPQLRSLRLDNLSLIGISCDNLQFSAMEALREVRLINVREHDGSLQWSTFIPSTLNQSTKHFEYSKFQSSSSDADNYTFFRFLKGQPLFSFQEMQELRIPRPVTAADVDLGIDLLRRCPNLQALGFEQVVFQQTWGVQIDELGLRLPPDCLSQLRVINGPPGLISTVVAGRPIHKARILLDRQTELSLLSTLEALRQSTVPLEGLSIFTSKWKKTSLPLIVELFPQLQGLAICVKSVPVMRVADWELQPLFALDRLERICLFALDGDGRPPPQHLAAQRRSATALFQAIPSLHSSWLHVLSEPWKRGGTQNRSSLKTLGNRVRGLWGAPTWR